MLILEARESEKSAINKNKTLTDYFPLIRIEFLALNLYLIFPFPYIYISPLQDYEGNNKYDSLILTAQLIFCF